jgi:predicted DNA-binding transcriptional regulator AlpA
MGHIMARTLRMLTRRDLKDRKGIPWSRQHLHRKIEDGEFPPPDGKTSDGPKAPNFWFESTIDEWLKARAEKRKAEQERQPAETTATI